MSLGYTTKNIPDAIQWHFAGTWNHMFNNVNKYKNTWKKEWQFGRDLLKRSIALPILVKSNKDYIDKHVSAINNILKSI